MITVEVEEHATDAAERSQSDVELPTVEQERRRKYRHRYRIHRKRKQKIRGTDMRARQRDSKAICCYRI